MKPYNQTKILSKCPAYVDLNKEAVDGIDKAIDKLAERAYLFGYLNNDEMARAVENFFSAESLPDTKNLDHLQLNRWTSTWMNNQYIAKTAVTKLQV